MKKEPAVTVGTITAIATAALALVAAFGLDLDTQQQAAILGVLVAASPVVAALITRRKVTPVDAPPRHLESGRVALGLVAVVTVLGAILLLAPAAQAMRDTNWPCAGCVRTHR